MSDNSRIEWTDASWTPIRARRKDTGKVGWHCERVSDGCKHCYSATFNGRMLPNGGTGLDYTRQARDKVDIFLDDKTLSQPLRWRKPRRVFVCSMTDLFAEFVPFDFIDRVFAVMALCPQHTFQVLTKRPERMAEWLNGPGRGITISKVAANNFWGDRDWIPEVVPGFNNRSIIKIWPLPNVWLGASVEDQAAADQRIPHMLRCPAAVRFLSAEPLLGPVDLNLRKAWSDGRIPTHSPVGRGAGDINWVIVGGESGPGARPMHPDWVRSLRDQCAAAGVAFFFKQWGAWLPAEAKGKRSFLYGGDPTERHLESKPKIHEWPDGWVSLYTGKHAAGRLLGGREWSEFPEALTQTQEQRDGN